MQSPREAATLLVMRGIGFRPNRIVTAMAALAWLLLGTACVATDPEPLSAIAPSAAPEPPASAYVSMLRAQGIEAAIPPRGKFILVNIPSFELIALQDGMPVLRSRVIVGRPVSTTPELQSSIYALRFNPAWVPTPLMIRNEGLHYMPPGPQNPLGRMMFAMDNDEFIYLHDTNEKELFKRAQRALSHGCIRVEQVRALAAWSLGVSPEEIDAMISRGTYSVPLPEEIPISLVYFTRFPDEQGELVSYPDIYGSRPVAERNMLSQAVR
jgi:murein L,D-transpeptidase YcbB/YkuD